jgi:hypothetical protein
MNVSVRCFFTLLTKNIYGFPDHFQLFFEMIFEIYHLLLSWTNLSRQDEPWAEFSALEVAACHAMHLLHSIAIRSNLELKTRPKQLLGSLRLDITLPAVM